MQLSNQVHNSWSKPSLITFIFVLSTIGHNFNYNSGKWCVEGHNAEGIISNESKSQILESRD